MTLTPTPLAQAHSLAKKVANAGGCIPVAAIPMLEAIIRERDEIRERLAEKEANEAAYERLIGPKTYREVAEELSDLREKLRFSEDNRKLLAMEKFTAIGASKERDHG